MTLIRASLTLLGCLTTLSSASAAAPPARPRLDVLGDPLPMHAVARLGTVQFRHTGGIDTLAWSRDGKTLASAGSGTVRAWKISGKPLGRLTLGREGYSRNAFHFDHQFVFDSAEGWLAVAARDGRPVVCDLLTGKQLRQLPATAHVPEALSPDGKTAATRGEMGVGVILWDFATGIQRHRLEVFTLALAFSPDGSTLATGELDPKPAIFFRDVRNGQVLRRLPMGRDSVIALAFAPDGKTLAVSHGPDWLTDPGSRASALTLRDAVTGKELKVLSKHEPHVGALAFSPDGKTLAAASAKGLDSVKGQAIELWDVATGRRVKQTDGHSSQITAVAFGRAGKEVITAGEDTTVRAWSVSGMPLRAVSLWKEHPERLVLSADGSRIAWADRQGRPRVRNLTTGKDLPRIGVTAAEYPHVALSPQGDVLALYRPLRNARSVRVWDLTKNVPIQLPETADDDVTAVSLSLDGKTLVLGSLNHTTIHRLDSIRRPLRLDHRGWAEQLALSADARVVAISSHNQTVTLRETASGKERWAVKHPVKDTDSRELFESCPIALSPDGSLLATGGVGTDWSIRLWDVAAMREVGTMHGHEGQISALAFSPDSTRLVSGGEDHSAFVWDVASVVPRRSRPRPSRERLRACWGDLADENAAKAHRAMWDLVADAKGAVAVLAEHLKPVPASDRVQRWVRELDSDDLETREEATRQLQKAGEPALGALLEAMRSKPSLEVYRRAERLVRSLNALSPELIQQLRAVEVLERFGNEEAQRLLQRLAKGAAGARLTEDATASLERLRAR